MHFACFAVVYHASTIIVLYVFAVDNDSRRVIDNRKTREVHSFYSDTRGVRRKVPRVVYMGKQPLLVYSTLATRIERMGGYFKLFVTRQTES